MPARVAKPAPRPWLMLREAISSMSGPGVAVSARAATANSARVERPVERSTTRLEGLVGQEFQEGREIGLGLGLLAVGGELGRRHVDHLHRMTARLPIGHLLGFTEMPLFEAAGRVVADQLLESLMVLGRLH